MANNWDEIQKIIDEDEVEWDEGGHPGLPKLTPQASIRFGKNFGESISNVLSGRTPLRQKDAQKHAWKLAAEGAAKDQDETFDPFALDIRHATSFAKDQEEIRRLREMESQKHHTGDYSPFSKIVQDQFIEDKEVDLDFQNKVTAEDEEAQNIQDQLNQNMHRRIALGQGFTEEMDKSLFGAPSGEPSNTQLNTGYNDKIRKGYTGASLAYSIAEVQMNQRHLEDVRAMLNKDGYSKTELEYDGVNAYPKMNAYGLELAEYIEEMEINNTMIREKHAETLANMVLKKQDYDFKVLLNANSLENSRKTAEIENQYKVEAARAESSDKRDMLSRQSVINMDAAQKRFENEQAQAEIENERAIAATTKEYERALEIIDREAQINSELEIIRQEFKSEQARLDRSLERRELDEARRSSQEIERLRRQELSMQQEQFSIQILMSIMSNPGMLHTLGGNSLIELFGSSIDPEMLSGLVDSSTISSEVANSNA